MMMAVVIDMTLASARPYLWSKVQEQVNLMVIWLTVDEVPWGNGLYARARDGLGWS